MGVVLKKNRNGTGLRPMWYIRYKEDGKSIDMATPVAIAGKPPASMKISDEGDAPFERSKARAQAYLEDFLNKRKIRGINIQLTKQLIQETTGREIVDVKLADLYPKWIGFSRDRQVSESRAQSTKAAFKRFTNFLANSRNPSERKWEYLYDVTPEAARRYIDELKGTLAVSTVKDHLSLLSGTFRRLLPQGVQNPFADIRAGSGTADDKKISRKPLTDNQLKRLYEVAQQSTDQYLYPITVCAANTGLRIGDVCQLKWTDVYLDRGEEHISTITGKTHTLVHIPIFPDLLAVIETALAEKEDGEQYVFPEAASCYQHNRSGLIRRGKHLFAEALFSDIVKAKEPVEVINGMPRPPLTTAQILDAIDHSRFIAKKKSLAKEVYSRFALGQSYTQIASELNILRSRICTLLKNTEELTGETIRPWAKADLHSKRLALTRKSHSTCKNASSIYGWHTLRANFCVQAMFKNIPEPLICQIVGHSTFETTKASYLHPTWEVFKENWDKSRIDSHNLLCQTSPEQAAALKAILLAAPNDTSAKAFQTPLLA